MICGNQKNQDILKKYFQDIKQTSKIPLNFLLLDWPSNIWKSTLVQELVKDFLWEYYKTDFLHIPDLSDYLGKKQSFKIEVDQKDQNVKIDWIWSFYDMWTRDIVEWLFKSPLWGYKILLLENIERMSLWAANAFLKTFEEPLKNRIIIATTSNAKILLDTILSRAFILRFDLLDDDELKEYLFSNYQNISEEKLDLLVDFSMWKIWFAINLIQEADKFEEILNQFESYMKLTRNKSNYTDKFTILKDVYKNWKLDMFLDALIYSLGREENFQQVQKIFQIRKMIDANVWVENALFYMNL